MKIKVAHLYYDLLNLYGESGNIKALKKYLENQGIEVEVIQKTMFNEFNFNNYDFVYIGMGTENNQLIALNDLMRYKEDIKNYIANNGFFLATGNSLELFGKYVIDNDNEKHKALNIFPFSSIKINKRLICESVLEDSNLDNPIIGFQNRGSKIINNKKWWFTTIKNFKSSDNDDINEGIHLKNFYGTYIIGPILARNPHLLKQIGDLLILSKYKTFDIKDVDIELENMAYDSGKKRFVDREKDVKKSNK